MPQTTENGTVRTEFFAKFFRQFTDGNSQDEVEELTKQFYVTLRASFAKVKSTNGQVRNAEAFRRIEELLSNRENESWANAYEIEQLLVHLLDDATLSTELRVRSLEARSILNKDLAAAYDAQISQSEAVVSNGDANAQATNAERRRILLSRMVNDLQWRYIVNEASRRYSKAITRRTSYLSVGALVAFGIVTAMIFWWSVQLKYDDLRLLGISGLAGAWGATFSMLATLQSRLEKSSFDALKLMRARAVLVSRALIGAGAACILFFFLLSGLLGGTAFPSLIAPGTGAAQQAATPASTSPTLPQKDLALLVVWCFIAGFSEQLIPGLLSSTEKRALPSGSEGSDRFKPDPDPKIVADDQSSQKGGDKPAAEKPVQSAPVLEPAAEAAMAKSAGESK